MKPLLTPVPAAFRARTALTGHLGHAAQTRLRHATAGVGRRGPAGAPSPCAGEGEHPAALCLLRALLRAGGRAGVCVCGGGRARLTSARIPAAPRGSRIRERESRQHGGASIQCHEAQQAQRLHAAVRPERPGAPRQRSAVDRQADPSRVRSLLELDTSQRLLIVQKESKVRRAISGRVEGADVRVCRAGVGRDAARLRRHAVRDCGR
jgi:hypothetical protein